MRAIQKLYWILDIGQATKPISQKRNKCFKNRLIVITSVVHHKILIWMISNLLAEIMYQFLTLTNYFKKMIQIYQFVLVLGRYQSLLINVITRTPKAHEKTSNHCEVPLIVIIYLQNLSLFNQPMVKKMSESSKNINRQP